MKLDKVSFYGPFLLLVLATLLIPATVFAQGAGYYTVSQGDMKVQITPLEGPGSAIDYYNFTDNQSNTGLEEANTAVFFLYQDSTSGTTSLFVLLGGANGIAGATTVALSGVPAGADFTVKDDELDFRDVWELTPPTGNVTWAWDDTKSDGMVFGPLGRDFEISLFPQFTTGIMVVKFLSGNAMAPTEISLNLIDAFTIKGTPNMPPEVSFIVTPGAPHIDEPITFDASGSFDPDGTMASYDWDFDGDGLFDRTTTDPVTTYSYAVSGLKSVTLKATDSEGASARVTYTLDVSALAVKVMRTISTMSALPGNTFLVVVRIEPEMDLAGVGLEENLPVGWKIKPLENAGAAFKRSSVQWVFIDQIKAGTTKVISYEVTVPSSEELIATTLPVCFTISGVFQVRTPAFELPVEGDSQIEITDALSIKTAIAHLVPRVGDDMEDTIDLRLSQKITPNQLSRALEMWQNDETVPWTQGAMIDLETMKELSAYAYTCTPVDLPLPLTPIADVTAMRTIATPVPCGNILLNYYGPGGDQAGNTFTVKVEIVADEDLYGVGLKEELPTGWRVIPVENDGFLYKRSRIEWVFPSKVPAGTMKTIIYQVEVPQTATIEMMASDPCYVSTSDIYGTVDVALPCLDTPVTGDSAVAVSDCLSVIVAISRWDVENDRIDITLSNKISFQQVQRAIAFWLEDEEVPRTCGGVVSYEILKTIIAYWLTNTDICDPLPGSVAPFCGPDLLPCGSH
ncbi:PKD domain-containing protein [Candidatus Bipolaricaulota bacterium]|nr:PKD domain-containing protein [Candidatus Bipolaricaulota bacterium]